MTAQELDVGFNKLMTAIQNYYINGHYKESSEVAELLSEYLEVNTWNCGMETVEKFDSTTTCSGVEDDKPQDVVVN